MAVAETAEMAVRLSLDSSRFSQSINRIDRRLGAFSGAVNRNLGHAVDSVVSKGINLAFDAVRGGLDNLARLETATTQVTGAIKTMGKTGQVSADQIAGWAVQIETSVQSAFDDKDITAATATLIRYGNVATANLKPAMVVMTDLAARTGDVGSASKLLAKALADPTKAAGALRKAGIVLTTAQDKQIKSLIKQGKLTEAQSALLGILAKRTKGAAAAMNGPAVDAQKELGDAWEEATKALATGLLPVITRFNTFLKDKLSDPTVIANIKKIGDGIGKAADQALTFAQSIPWDKVANGLHTAADFAGKLIGVFTSLPPEAQGAIIALAGLNKLSGGAVTGIVSELSKGLIKGVLGMTAGVVNLKAGVVNGGGGGIPGAAGSTGGKLGALGKVADIASKVVIVGMVAEVADMIKPAVTGAGIGIHQALGLPDFKLPIPDEWPWGPKNTPTILPNIFGGNGLLGGTAKDTAPNPNHERLGPPAPPPTANHVFVDSIKGNVFNPVTTAVNRQELQTTGAIARLKERLAGVLKSEAQATRAGDSRHAAALAAKESAIRGQLSAANAKLAAIRAKKTSFSTKVNVNVNTSVRVSEIQRAARVSSRVARTTQNAYR